MSVTLAAVVALAAAALSAGLNRALRPLFLRYALARPNARSSHAVATPQGGGIGVVAAALACGLGGAGLATGEVPGVLAVVAGSALALAVLGGIDDVRPLPAGLRLGVQALAVAAVVTWASPGRVLQDSVPLALERALLVLAGLWWVNLVNFMDGIDWITVAEFVPMTLALAAFGLAGFLSGPGTLLAAALLGGVLGFAPANRPVARLFLGDVGSLSIGLLSGWLLLDLAASGALAAALLLPLYYLADATLTLARRLVRRERVWEAHRSHYYQRARAHLAVAAIDAYVAGLNLALIGLAAATLLWPHPAVVGGALALGLMLVGITLRRFGRDGRSI